MARAVAVTITPSDIRTFELDGSYRIGQRPETANQEVEAAQVHDIHARYYMSDALGGHFDMSAHHQLRLERYGRWLPQADCALGVTDQLHVGKSGKCHRREQIPPIYPPVRQMLFSDAQFGRGSCRNSSCALSDSERDGRHESAQSDRLAKLFDSGDSSHHALFSALRGLVSCGRNSLSRSVCLPAMGMREKASHTKRMGAQRPELHGYDFWRRRTTSSNDHRRVQLGVVLQGTAYDIGDRFEGWYAVEASKLTPSVSNRRPVSAGAPYFVASILPSLEAA